MLRLPLIPRLSRLPTQHLPAPIRHSSKKALARGKRLRGGGAVPGALIGGKLSTEMAYRSQSMLESIRTPKSVTNPISRWRILRGDLVEVISGPETGKRGNVLEVVRASNRVVVEGVGFVTKQVQQPGGERKKPMRTEAPIYVSRVAVVCPKTDLPTRVTFAFTEDGAKVRVAKRSGAVIPRPEILKVRRKERAPDGPKDTPPMVALHRSFKDEDSLYEHYEGFKELVGKKE